MLFQGYDKSINISTPIRNSYFIFVTNNHISPILSMGTDVNRSITRTIYL